MRRAGSLHDVMKGREAEERHDAVVAPLAVHAAASPRLGPPVRGGSAKRTPGFAGGAHALARKASI